MCALDLRGRDAPDAAAEPFPQLRPESAGSGERAIALAAGSILLALGARRRSVPGWLIAGVGGAMLYRGATGHSALGRALGREAAEGFQLRESFLVQRPAEELYRRWRDLESLPSILTHLESVRGIDERRSRWVVAAPALAGGRVEWEAEIVHDVPGRAIAWRSLPGADVENAGEIRFEPAPGERGTEVHVWLEYRPPAGLLGEWVATLSGLAARQQVREDLRAFKRVMETGEVPTIDGQPIGHCAGLARFRKEGRTS